MLNYLALVLVGIAMGITSGLFGVGGGVIVVPALVLLWGFSQQAAQGASLAIMIPTALMGVITYSRNGNVSWPTALAVAVGAVGAAWFGADLAQRLPQDTLKILFACLLVAMAVRIMPLGGLAGTSREMGLLLGVLLVAAGVRLVVALTASG